jgi:hypothetical protein
MVTRDLLWKGIITSLVDDFLAFFFPDFFDQFDLERGVEFLDQELIQLFPESEASPRYVDRLLKVYMANGSPHYFLIHVEVQGYTDEKFAERMFIYFYRLYDRYRLPITSLAIFTDAVASFHPKEFRFQFLHTELIYRYQTYKLMDKVIEELNKMSNPFAIVMEAARITLERSIGTDEAIYENKFRLIRKMIDLGYDRRKIQTILGFITYYQPFFESEYSRKFEKKVNEMAETKGLIELIKDEMFRQGHEEGREEVILQLLKGGMSPIEILKLTNISLEELLKIQAKLNDSN